MHRSCRRALPHKMMGPTRATGPRNARLSLSLDLDLKLKLKLKLNLNLNLNLTCQPPQHCSTHRARPF